MIRGLQKYLYRECSNDDEKVFNDIFTFVPEIEQNNNDINSTNKNDVNKNKVVNDADSKKNSNVISDISSEGFRKVNNYVPSFDSSEELLNSKIEDLKSEELNSIKIDLISISHGPSYDTNSIYDLSKIISGLLLTTELD